MDPISLLVIILATVITFGLYSALTGMDNPFYAFAEYSYVGAGVALLFVMSLLYLQQKVLASILSNPAENWFLIISIAVGLLMLTRVSSKYSYLARIPIVIGVSIGLGISTRTIIFTNITMQIQATIKPLWGVDSFTAFTNLSVLLFVVLSLFSFLYTYEVKGPVKKVSDLGIYVLYAGFGALFAQTFMGRIGLFLGRMETMLFPEIQLYLTIAISGIILVIIYVLKKKYPELLDRIMPR